MDSQIQDAVTGWETRPVADGYEGLRDLADQEFSGAVSARRTWAFLLNGRVVGVVDGQIAAFEGTPLSAYEAPDPALPLLYAMQTGESRERAKYYSEETPISEADSTLSEGGFTGYIELSENVLSGDYYVVYHGGKSMSAAFLGNQRRLLTGEEAFQRADDEIGVYYVHEADVEVVEVPSPDPEPAADPDSGTGTAVGAGSPTDPGPDDPSGPDADADDPPTPDADPAETPGPDDGVGRPDDSPAAPAAGSTGAADAGTTADASADDPPTADAGADDARDDLAAPDAGDGADDLAAPDAGDGADDRPTSDAEDGAGDRPTSGVDDRRPGRTDAATARSDAPEGGDGAADATADAGGPGTTRDGREAGDGRRSSDDARTGPGGATAADVSTDDGRGTPGGADGSDGGEDVTFGAGAADDGGDGDGSDGGDSGPGADPFSAEERWREARGIPALDPDETGEGTAPTGAEAGELSTAGDGADREDTGERRSAGGDASRAEAVRRGRGADDDRLSALRERVEAAETARDEAETAREDAERRADRLEAQLSDSREEASDLREERDEHRERAERLSARVEELESEVSRLEAQLESADVRPDAESVDAVAALAGTHLFVRYDSASGATLSKAHDGQASGDEVAGNLRLEYHHTDFDTEDVVVDGEAFDDFLHATTQYQFVEWVVHDLLYEIGETGNRDALGDLFDAVPEVDHIEFDGGVTVPTGEGEEARSESLAFDVVVRDGMGNPLLVADLNTARSAASEAMMRELITKARRVGETKDTLAGAFLVTSSFFDPGALEAAADETASGGFFGGSTRKSYVKLSRKSGFHVCLVETRDGAFHVNVPDL